MSDPTVAVVSVTPVEKSMFEKLMDIIYAVEPYSPPTLPLPEAVAEGRRIAAIVKEDRDKLRPTGIDPQYLDSIETRAGAFVWCQTT